MEILAAGDEMTPIQKFFAKIILLMIGFTALDVVVLLIMDAIHIPFLLQIIFSISFVFILTRIGRRVSDNELKRLFRSRR